MKHAENLRHVRELMVTRRRAAATHLVAVMDSDPEAIDPWLAKVLKHQDTVEILDRAIADESDT